MTRRPVRIANCSGFYGDRLAAMREVLEGGPVDVVTGDYLAELTMLLLARSRMKDPSKGYASTFLKQLADCAPLLVATGARVVVNAGGLDPASCAAAAREVLDGTGLLVAHVEGDDLLPLRDRVALPDGALTANAYLGGWGITACLEAGAHVVVTGRVTDAALVTGTAAWWHGWQREDWDALAGAVVAGHVVECGTQATGGNFSFFQELPGVEHLGFPIAEVEADGSSTITKHAGTGGAVTTETVTAQLLYETGGPLYLGPDVVADLASVRLEQAGQDRVRVSGVRGLPPPPTLKAGVNVLGGFRSSTTFLLTGLDVEAKAALVRRQVEPLLDGVAEAHWSLARTAADDPAANPDAVSLLTLTAKDPDGKRVGRRLTSGVVELALASYPGFTLSAPPADASPYGVFSALAVDPELVPHVAVLPDGSRVEVPHTPGAALPDRPASPASPPVEPDHDLVRVPLGRLVGARSGDKGGDANLGVWARDDATWDWLRGWLTVDVLVALLPEAAGLDVERHELPALRAVNFVLHGLLGDGVAGGVRQDPQAKGLGEWLRARHAAVPARLL